MESFSFEHLDAGDWAGEVAWLRTLAASLVRDPDEAADLAGDVWVQALQRRPEIGESRPLRAWLTVVTRRMAARRRREGGARMERERSSARGDTVPPADDAILRVELQKKLVEAVLALDEPYRSAVVLRHLEQLAPAKIAQRQGCTSEAARQRIARGLQQLRARLDRDFEGGRSEWKAVLAPFAAHAPFASSVALGGATIVSTKVVGGLVAFVAAALLFWFWPQLSGIGLASSAADESLRASALEAPEKITELLDATLSGGVRDAAGRASRALRISGRVVNSQGEPLSAVHIEFEAPDGSTIAGTESDGTGRFVTFQDSEAQTGQTLAVLARSAEFCEANVRIAQGEEATIVMQRLPRVEVRVLTPDGASPTCSGFVRLLFRDKGSGRRTTSVEVDETGVARSDPLPQGQLLRVSAHFDGFAVKDVVRTDELQGDAIVQVEVTLARGVTLRGVVLDEQTLRPVPGALVRVVPTDPRDWRSSPATTADDAGKFELRGILPTQRAYFGQTAKSDVYRLDVEAQDFLFLPPRGKVLEHPSATIPPPLVENIELFLVPAGCELNVTLRWPDGRDGGRSYFVKVVDPSGNVYWVSPNAEGTFHFPNLPAEKLHLVAIGTEGSAIGDVTLERGEKRNVELVLRRADAVITGRIVDAEGRGAPGIELVCWSSFGEDRVNDSTSNWADRTDAQGNFRFEGVHPGDCEIHLSDDDATGASLWPPLRKLKLESGTTATVEFVARPAIACAGKLDPDAPLDPGPLVMLELVHAEFGVIAAAQADEEGAFEIFGACDADYVLVAKQNGHVLGRLAVPRGGSRNLIVPLGR